MTQMGAVLYGCKTGTKQTLAPPPAGSWTLPSLEGNLIFPPKSQWLHPAELASEMGTNSYQNDPEVCFSYGSKSLRL